MAERSKNKKNPRPRRRVNPNPQTPAKKPAAAAVGAVAPAAVEVPESLPVNPEHPAAAAPAGPVAAPAAPTAAELLADDANAKKIIKAKGSKNIAVGIANILATFNNTNVSITDMHGNVPRLGSPLDGSVSKARLKAPPSPPNRSRRMPRVRRCRTECVWSSPRQRPWLRSRIGHPRFAGHRRRKSDHQRRHTHPAQRLPPAQKTPRWLNLNLYGSLHRTSHTHQPPFWHSAFRPGQIPGAPQLRPRRSWPQIAPQGHTDYGLGLIEKPEAPLFLRSDGKAISAGVY